MTLQGATLAMGTTITPLAAYKCTRSTASKRKGTNVLQSANKYALNSAFVNGSGSLSPHTNVRGLQDIHSKSLAVKLAVKLTSAEIVVI
ncbi:hypothetical protein SUGI_0575400 [Cryptomeria japonica]|nr:hypothetical protein SUGI_0575400 [Cryptomeria japonica]